MELEPTRSTTPPFPPSPRGLLDHVLLAVASDEDARQTSRALLRTLGNQIKRVTVVTVVPEYRQWADSISSDYRLEVARDTLLAARSLLSEAGLEVDVAIEQAAKTSRAIQQLAEHIDASVILITPRSANRWADLLSGDTTWSLVKKSSRPVLVVPAV